MRNCVSGFRDLFIVTLINPKAFLFASTLLPPEMFRSLTYFSWTLAAFQIVLVPIGFGCSCPGRMLTSRRSWATRTPILSRCASLVLVMFSRTLGFSVLSK
ncbi:hypothetical protein A6V36_36085 [Paraburkholderia ginsengiterrae]|uniref:Uncharacterized protein n=1 Tax=Paraburkholderia ginsengiterrae TaxID=1462993 RepID=A0A1A9MYL9_9BURK|nr:hypothetical protein A6V37_35410 [Paraburkholderia ginsengiterrae]OAJ54322.1 hypothetical protein A6V36_36085 [Paraburkholderia ginsengiterrae]